MQESETNNMESPGIDLDMNLRCSPSDVSPSVENSPSWNDDNIVGGVEISKCTKSGTIETVENENCDGVTTTDVLAVPTGNSGTEFNMQNDDGDLDDTKAGRGSPEVPANSEENESTGKKQISHEDYEANVRLVESWKEELYMMNIKNSILLDDLVKVGADV